MENENETQTFTNKQYQIVHNSLRALIRLRLYMSLRMTAAHKLMIGMSVAGVINSKTPLNYRLPRTRSDNEWMTMMTMMKNREKKQKRVRRRRIKGKSGKINFYPKKATLRNPLDSSTLKAASKQR